MQLIHIIDNSNGNIQSMYGLRFLGSTSFHDTLTLNIQPKIDLSQKIKALCVPLPPTSSRPDRNHFLNLSILNKKMFAIIIIGCVPFTHFKQVDFSSIMVCHIEIASFSLFWKAKKVFRLFNGIMFGLKFEAAES